MYNLLQFGASERVSRVNWFSSGLQSAFRESIGGFRARFASQLVQLGLQSAFRESIGSVRGFRAQSANHLSKFGTLERRSIGSVRGFRARFASQLVYNLIQFGASERVSRVNWFSSGLQSTFRESIGSVRVFRARFASQLGASERVLRVNWFSAGLQSAFRESISSARGFRARFASQLVQFGTSECVS